MVPKNNKDEIKKKKNTIKVNGVYKGNRSKSLEFHKDVNKIANDSTDVFHNFAGSLFNFKPKKKKGRKLESEIFNYVDIKDMAYVNSKVIEFDQELNYASRGVDKNIFTQRFKSHYEHRNMFKDFLEFALKLEKMQANYIAEQYEHKKSALGVILHAKIKFYNFIRPAIIPIVKNTYKKIVGKGFKALEKSEANDFIKVFSKQAYDQKESDILKAILILDENLVNIDKRIKFQLESYSEKLKKIKILNEKFKRRREKKEKLSKGGFLKFRQAIVLNINNVEKIIKKAIPKKKKGKELSPEKKEEILEIENLVNNVIKKLNESKDNKNLIEKINNCTSDKELSSLLYQYAENNKKAIDFLVKKIKKENKSLEYHSKFIKILDKSLIGIIDSYQYNHPSLIESNKKGIFSRTIDDIKGAVKKPLYEIQNKYEDALYIMANGILFYKESVFDVVEYFINQGNIISGAIFNATLSSKIKIKPLQDVVSVLHKSFNDFLKYMRKKSNKRLFDRAESFVSQYGSVYSKYKKIIKQKKIKSNKFSNLRGKVKGEDVSIIGKKEFEEYKKVMLKNIESLEKIVNLQIPKNSKNHKRKWIADNINKIKKILEDKSLNIDKFINRNGDQLVASLNSLAESVKKNSDSFDNMSAKEVKAFLKGLNNFTGRTIYMSKYLEWSAKSNYFAHLYSRFNSYSGRKIKFPKIDINNIDKKIKEIKTKIKKLPTTIHDSIESKIKTDDENDSKMVQGVKRILDVGFKITKAALVAHVAVHAVISPVAKALIPHLGGFLGGLGGGAIGGAVGNVPGVVIGNTVGNLIGSEAGMLGVNLCANINDEIANAIKIKPKIDKLKEKINTWITTHFQKKKKQNLATVKINSAMADLVVKSKVLCTHISSIVKDLQKEYKSDPEILKIKDNWKDLEKMYNSRKAVDFSKALSLTNKNILKLHMFIESKMGGANNEEKIENQRKSERALKGKKSSAEVMTKLFIASNKFYEATDKFKNNKQVKSMILNKTISPSTMLSLKKVERNLCYFVASVNQVLMTVMPIVTIAAGITGGIAAGVAADTATFGTSLGLFTVGLGAVGGALGGVVGKVLSGGLGWVNKKIKRRIDTLDKTLAIYNAYNFKKPELKQIASKAAKKKLLKKKVLEKRNKLTPIKSFVTKIFKKPLKRSNSNIIKLEKK